MHHSVGVRLAFDEMLHQMAIWDNVKVISYWETSRPDHQICILARGCFTFDRGMHSTMSLLCWWHR